jgi:sterol desaturase/sphingolipid hydroxylase (fatty acid hydroxylase superfamily)
MDLNENTVRLGCFFGTLAAMIAWEVVSPRRGRVAGRAKRWGTNFGMIVAGTVPLQWLFPVLAVGMAEIASERGWGLLNNWPMPAWAAVVLSIVLLDGIIYFQHVVFHFVPLLWRLHKVHHTDRDLDATSALRFHPVEIWISMGIKLAAVTLVGPPVIGVIAFEVILNATAMFNHSCVWIPLWLDRVLRLLVVTPDMHRVHHSVYPRETNTNFGFNLPWWDRLFGTYRAQPTDGHRDMTIGLTQYPEAGKRGLLWALILPFRAQTNRAGDARPSRKGDTL